jgi:hypothetical protein
MKNICSLITYSICLLAASLSFAQEKGTSDMGFNVGFGTSTEIVDLAAEIITSPLNSGYAEDTTVGATFGLTYKYAIKNNWNILVDGYYQQIDTKIIAPGGEPGKAEYSYYTIGVGTDYSYLHKGIFRLYSGVAAGYTFEDASYSGSVTGDDSNGGFFNFHLNALGVRVGNKLAGRAEIGFGYKGIINAGISYQF